ncbi:MAG: TIGR03619 family F420-dependent LLM class oxidoreductase [Proteobacteria bacterium]|nr:TIGR03619 family F420-dependent LLM class oxidoreductase [Pseudomonadota bacterium]
MKFGLGFPCMSLYPPTLQPWEAGARGEDLVAVARRAEEAGFDYLSFSDHVVMSAEMEEAMGARWCESLTSMAFVAGATRRIQVYSSVLVLPYRDPVMLAKQCSTLDFMSDGRLVLGVGIGHLEREFEVLRVSRPQRGPITDEYLAALKVLWTEEKPRFEGEFTSFDGIVFEPKPVRKPHPPLWIGGNSPAAIRRAARFGDGWVPWKITPEELPACLEELRAQPGFEARDRPFDVVMPGTIIQREEGTQRVLGETVIPEGTREWCDVVEANARGGATVTSVTLGHTPTLSAYLDKLSEFGEEVIGGFSQR